MSSLTSLYGGGGGGTPVNSIAKLFVGGQTQYTDESGSVWLKTGEIISIDSATYPDAYANNQEISDSSYDSVFVSVLSDNFDLKFSSDGTRFFYATSSTRSSIEQYNLSDPSDLSSAVRFTSFFTSSQDGFPRGVAFNNDGTKMFVFGATNNRVFQYSLTNPYNISAVTYDNISSPVVGGGPIVFSDDGLKLYTIDNVTAREYTLSSAFDVSSLTLTNTKSFSGIIGSSYALTFLSEGTKMYIVSAGASGRPVYQFTLSTAFDLSTATYDNESFSIVNQDGSPYGITFLGAKMYINGQSSDKIYQYTAGLSYMGLGSNTGTYDYIKLK